MIGRFEGLDLIDRVPEELWTEVCNIVQEAVTKTIPKKNKRKKVKYLRNSYNSWEKRETKGKGKRKRYTQLNAEFQKTARREKKESESESHSVLSNSLRPHGLYSPWNSPGQNTGVGSLSLLQGIFLTQESNQGSNLHFRQIFFYQLSYQGSLIDKKAFLNQQCK